MFERVSWAVMAIVLILATLGFAGPGPLSHRRVSTSDGNLRIDLGLRQAWRGTEPIALSRKEWGLLALLMQHAGRVVTQTQLLRDLWGPTHTGDTHYLRILTAKLRAKLGDDAAEPRYIATEPGVGLRFMGS